MTRHPENLDPIEQGLLDLHAAERAGLFSRTPIDAERLVPHQPTVDPVAPMAWNWRLAPVAAAVVLSLGVGSWMFQREVANIRNVQQHSQMAVAASSSDFVRFHERFTGPMRGSAVTSTEPQSEDAVDADADGDVDLADFGAYQVAYAGASR